MSTKEITIRRLYREIAEQLLSKIEQGEFPLGTRLPAERDLAEQFNVSRSSVREALIALEIRGYVDVRVGSGVYVCSLLPREAQDHAAQEAWDVATAMGPFELLEARLLVEPECAALAAQNGSDGQLQKIATIHQAIEMADRMRESDRSMGPKRYDRMFHEALANACGNAALASVCSHLWDLSERSPVFTRLDEHFVTSAVWRQAWSEHSRIVQAILARDGVRARHAMAFHIHAIMARLKQESETVWGQTQAALS